MECVNWTVHPHFLCLPTEWLGISPTDSGVHFQLSNTLSHQEESFLYELWIQPWVPSVPQPCYQGPGSQQTTRVAVECMGQCWGSYSSITGTHEVLLWQNIWEAPNYKVGDMVWLSAKNITTTGPSKKLADKQLGPYPILQKVGPLNCELDLPVAMHIHPIFHVQLLGAHKPDTLRGIIPPPRPVVIEGKEEWELKKVMDSCCYHNQLQYLVNWKGTSPQKTHGKLQKT